LQDCREQQRHTSIHPEAGDFSFPRRPRVITARWLRNECRPAITVILSLPFYRHAGRRLLRRPRVTSMENGITHWANGRIAGDDNPAANRGTFWNSIGTWPTSLNLHCRRPVFLKAGKKYGR
jgi:hypothetical protein